jgi:hypothetical protein
MRIAESVDDFIVLCEVLRGDYPPSLYSRIESTLIAVVLGIGVPAVVVLALVADRCADIWMCLLLLLIGVSGSFSSWLIAVTNLSTYSVGADSFSRFSRLPFGSWTVGAFDLTSIDLVAAQGQPVLAIETRAGRNVTMPLDKFGCQKLKTLYPELCCPGDSVVLPRWTGWAAYTILAVALMVIVALWFWTWNQGYLN